MDKAFLELLQNKEFAYITVKEICEKAGVNRSTFYLHYENVGDLLEESLEYMQKKFLAGFSGKNSVMLNIESCPHDELMWITPDYLRPYLQFIEENRRLYRAAMEHPAVFGSEKTYRSMFEHIFDPVLRRFSVPEEQRRFIMAFFLKGIAGVIEEWLKGGCAEPIETVAQIIQNCIPKSGGA